MVNYYAEVVYLHEAMDFQQCAKIIAPIFPEKSFKEIQSAFEQYFWEDQASEELSRCDEVQEDIFALLVDFVAENQNESRLVARTAIELQMPLCESNVSPIYKPGAWL